MKKILLSSLIAVSLVVGVQASTEREATFNIYGVNAKTDKDQSSHSGVGIMFDSEEVKVKLEGTSDFIKAGAVLKFNPSNSKWYVKVGANAINQKMYAVDGSTDKINQYSGALATGYMVEDDLYIELGGSLTELKGKMIGVDYEIKDETTKLAYLEIAKRFDLGQSGTLDITSNVGRVNYDFVNNEDSYGMGMDYYPTVDAKIGYQYQNEKDNITNIYSMQYGYFFIEHSRSVSADTYQTTAGLKFAFDDITDFSTYRMSKNIKPHLSELHRFESVTFSGNMNIQSSGGVEKTAAKIAKDANVAAVVNAGSDVSVVVNNAITLTGTATDDTGTIVKTEWLKGTTVLATTLSFNYTPTSVGTDTLTFRAVDSYGVESTDTVTVTVTSAPNPDPTIAMANTSVNDEGGGAQPPFSPTISNVDAGAVYSIVGDPTGGKLTINASTGAMTWNGDLGSTTNYNMTIKVVNPDNTNASTTFVLTVNDNG